MLLCLFVFFCGLGFLQHVTRRSKFWKLRFPVLIMSGRLKTNIFEDHGVTVSVISHRRKNAIELSRLFFKIYKIYEVFCFFFFFQEVWLFFLWLEVWVWAIRLSAWRDMFLQQTFFFEKKWGRSLDWFIKDVSTSTYVSFQTKWDMFRRGQRFKQKGKFVCSQKKSFFFFSNKCGYLWTSPIL